MNQEHIAGAAVSTPLTAELTIDHAHLVNHVTQLLQRGMDVLTLFGTTGEGTSFSRAERAAALERCRDSGIAAAQLGCGVFGLASSDAGEDAKVAFASGCGHVLLAPPSYYKGIDDEGLFRWFSEAIEASGQNVGHFVLYHIPSMTQVELSVELVKRLAAQFPGVVAGVKDSSGNWPHTQRLIEERGSLTVLVGHEGHLERGVRLGAAGAISGTANFIPEVIKSIVHDNGKQPNLTSLIDELLKYPVISAVKALSAHRYNADSWLRVRPPLSPLDRQQAAALSKQLEALLPA